MEREVEREREGGGGRDGDRREVGLETRGGGRERERGGDRENGEREVGRERGMWRER